jgi:hypothetical protein
MGADTQAWNLAYTRLLQIWVFYSVDVNTYLKFFLGNVLTRINLRNHTILSDRKTRSYSSGNVSTRSISSNYQNNFCFFSEI